MIPPKTNTPADEQLGDYLFKQYPGFRQITYIEPDAIKDVKIKYAVYNPTLTAINTAISTDTTLSDNAKHALIELMRVAYEEVAVICRISSRIRFGS